MARNGTRARFLAALDEDGFFHWPRLLDAGVIDRHLAGFVALNAELGVLPGVDFHSYTEEKQQAIKQSRYAFHRESAAAESLIFSPALIDLLGECFGEEPVMRQPETGLYHRGTPDHTDSLDFKVDPAGREVRVWCALEDVHPDAGPVYFVPASHRLISASLEREVLGEQPHLAALLRSQLKPTTAREFFAATRPLWSYVKRDKLPAAIRDRGLARRPLLLRKGDAVVFRSDLVHGTCRCNDPTRTRKYFVAFWSAASSTWFHSRSFWGPLHDYRRPENSISAPLERTARGMRISFEELHAAYLRSFAKAVVQPAERTGERTEGVPRAAGSSSPLDIKGGLAAPRSSRAGASESEN